MHTYLLLVCFLLSASGKKSDDARINYNGLGFDILDYGFRESVFILESDVESDPTIPIRTKTLPNGITMLDVFKDDYHNYAEVIDKNVNVKDSLDIEIDGSVKYFLASASFTGESQIVKNFASRRNHKVTRTTSSIALYRCNLETTELNVSNGFYARINDVANLLSKNTPTSKKYAIYEVDQILNLYGTHVIISVLLGGKLTKIDAVDVNSYQNDVDEKLSACASASFASYFKVKGKIALEHSEMEKYERSVKSNDINTLGGDPWKENSTFDDWVETVKVNPVPIGLKIRYILDFIREQYLPNIPFDLLMAVRDLFEERIQVYMEDNCYKGCNDPKASNYVSYANVFSKEFCDYQKLFNYAGLYTISNNKNFAVANLITETTSCPEGFEAKPLLSLSFPHLLSKWCPRHCKHHVFWKICHRICKYAYEEIQTTTYICVSKENRTTGMYLGGIYTNKVVNEITQDKSCPHKYTPWPIYHNYDKTDVTYVCMAPYDIGKIVSVPIGGLFSNQYGNYEAGGKPVCPGGFERHSVGGNPIAELTYCIGLGSLEVAKKDRIPPGYGTTLNQALEFFPIYKFENGTFLSVQLNPYSNYSYEEQTFQIAIDVLEIDNSNDSILKLDEDFQEFVHYLKIWMNKHTMELSTNNNEKNAVNSLHNSPDVIFGIVTGVVAIIGVIVSIIYFAIRKRRNYRSF